MIQHFYRYILPDGALSLSPLHPWGFAWQMERMREQLEELGVMMGEVLIEALVPLAEALSHFAEALSEHEGTLE